MNLLRPNKQMALSGRINEKVRLQKSALQERVTTLCVVPVGSIQFNAFHI